MDIKPNLCLYNKFSSKYKTFINDAWQKLAFDKTTDNIDKFIKKVKRLARQLQFRDQSILIKLKQLFPEKADTWLVVHDLDEMCGYLKKIYSPYNLQQVDLIKTTTHAAAVAINPSSPFTASVMHTVIPYHLKVGVQYRRIHFDDPSLLKDSIEKLNSTLNHMDDGPPRNNRNLSSRPSKPYKPYILKGRGRRYNNQFHGRDCNCRNDSCNRHNSDSSHGCDRSWSRPPPRCFDQSPTTKKPRSSSKPVNKDKDRCFNCHQYRHFAHECPQKQREMVCEAIQEIHAMSSNPKAWLELDFPDILMDTDSAQPLN